MLDIIPATATFDELGHLIEFEEYLIDVMSLCYTSVLIEPYTPLRNLVKRRQTDTNERTTVREAGRGRPNLFLILLVFFEFFWQLIKK